MDNISGHASNDDIPLSLLFGSAKKRKRNVLEESASNSIKRNEEKDEVQKLAPRRSRPSEGSYAESIQSQSYFYMYDFDFGEKNPKPKSNTRKINSNELLNDDNTPIKQLFLGKRYTPQTSTSTLVQISSTGSSEKEGNKPKTKERRARKKLLRYPNNTAQSTVTPRSPKTKVGKKRLGRPPKKLGRPPKQLDRSPKKVGRPPKKVGRPPRKVGRPPKKKPSQIAELIVAPEAEAEAEAEAAGAETTDAQGDLQAALVAPAEAGVPTSSLDRHPAAEAVAAVVAAVAEGKANAPHVGGSAMPSAQSRPRNPRKRARSGGAVDGKGAGPAPLPENRFTIPVLEDSSSGDKRNGSESGVGAGAGADAGVGAGSGKAAASDEAGAGAGASGAAAGSGAGVPGAGAAATVLAQEEDDEVIVGDGTRLEDGLALYGPHMPVRKRNSIVDGFSGDGRRRCAVCGWQEAEKVRAAKQRGLMNHTRRNVRTSYYCSECKDSRGQPIPLCWRPSDGGCFQEFHQDIDTWLARTSRRRGRLGGLRIRATEAHL